MKIIELEKKVLQRNDEIAEKNRKLFKQHKLFVLNWISAPGSGKTALLEQIAKYLGPLQKFGVIEGDVQTSNDSQRLDKHNIPVVQIVTQGSCHLNAQMVRQAAEQLSLEELRFLVIENVGNLVCPSTFDLGETMKVAIMSITEGEDKPIKYPALFHRAQIMILNKIDLIPYLSCDISLIEKYARQVNPQIRIFHTSALTGEGIDKLCAWLTEQATAFKREGEL